MLKPKHLIAQVGKTRGHFSSKANRAAKLIEMWPKLEAKFIGMINRGCGNSTPARLAYATLLMMETGIRVGNESSAEGWICENQIVARKSNKEKGIKKGQIIWRHPMYGKHVRTFGLTTLLNEHVTIKKKHIEISFVGKKLVDHLLIISHPTLVKWCPEDRENELFLNISYYELKKFIKKYVGKGFTPKDIRMAKVNLIFVHKFGNKPFNVQFDEATTKGARKKIIAQAIEETADIIGHTKSVCRSAYLSAPLLTHLTEYEP